MTSRHRSAQHRSIVGDTDDGDSDYPVCEDADFALMVCANAGRFVDKTGKNNASRALAVRLACESVCFYNHAKAINDDSAKELMQAGEYRFMNAVVVRDANWKGSAWTFEHGGTIYFPVSLYNEVKNAMSDADEVMASAINTSHSSHYSLIGVRYVGGPVLRTTTRMSRQWRIAKRRPGAADPRTPSYKQIDLAWVPTSDNLADGLTKPPIQYEVRKFAPRLLQKFEHAG